MIGIDSLLVWIDACKAIEVMKPEERHMLMIKEFIDLDMNTLSDEQDLAAANALGLLYDALCIYFSTDERIRQFMHQPVPVWKDRSPMDILFVSVKRVPDRVEIILQLMHKLHGND